MEGFGNNEVLKTFDVKLGPGILMLLYMYIAPGQGQTTPWGQMLMSTECPYHFAHLLQVLKQSI